MRLILIIILIPLVFVFGKVLAELLLSYPISNQYSLTFLLSYILSLIIFFLVRYRMSYLTTFEHELTHNIWAILTFKKPVGFHVDEERGGLFEYQGGSNYFIALSPYFFPTFTFFVFPLFFIIKNEYVLLHNIILGVTYGFFAARSLNETRPYQPDIRQYGLFFSYLFIIFWNIIIFGSLFSFIAYKGEGVRLFLHKGIDIVWDFIHSFILNKI